MSRRRKVITIEYRCDDTHPVPPPTDAFLEAFHQSLEVKFSEDFKARAAAAKRRGKLPQEEGVPLWFYLRALTEYTRAHALIYSHERRAEILHDLASIGAWDDCAILARAFSENTFAPVLEEGDVKLIRFWQSFDSLNAPYYVPPLSEWSEKAALEFYRFITAQPLFEAEAYRLRRRRLGLVKAKTTEIREAFYTKDGATHRLVCHR